MSIVNHVGLTTPDIYATIDWYTELFGLRLIMGPRVVASGPAETSQVFGEHFSRAYQAHLLSGTASAWRCSRSSTHLSSPLTRPCPTRDGACSTSP